MSTSEVPVTITKATYSDDVAGPNSKIFTPRLKLYFAFVLRIFGVLFPLVDNIIIYTSYSKIELIISYPLDA